MSNIYHYSSYLAFNFIRAFRGSSLMDDAHITPEDIAGIKVISDHGLDGGRVISFKFKDKIYSMEIRVIEPKILDIEKPLMCNDVIYPKGGLR